MNNLSLLFFHKHFLSVTLIHVFCHVSSDTSPVRFYVLNCNVNSYIIERDQSEEVFAEDYDDEGKTADPASSQSSPEPAPEKPSEALIYEVPACPNRSFIIVM